MGTNNLVRQKKTDTIELRPIDFYINLYNYNIHNIMKKLIAFALFCTLTLTAKAQGTTVIHEASGDYLFAEDLFFDIVKNDYEDDEFRVLKLQWFEESRNIKAFLNNNMIIELHELKENFWIVTETNLIRQ